MKDLLSAFGSEFFRPLVTLVLPGALGIGPFVVATLWSNSNVRQLADANPIVTAVILIAVAVFFGLLFEDIGSEIEVNLDKRANNKEPKGKHLEDWYDYLCLAVSTEPIGHRYIRTLVLRLKFELGSGVACAVAIFGTWWLPTTYVVRGATTLVLLAIASVLLFEAYKSHDSLAKVRSALLTKGIRESAAATGKT